MKKTILYLVMLVAFAALVQAQFSTHNNIIISENNNVKITLINQEPMPVEPGGYMKLRFRVENIGVEPAKHVMVELVPKYPFSFDASDQAFRDVSALNGWQTRSEGVVIEYKIRVDEDAVEGPENITIRYRVDQSPWIGQEFEIQIRTIDAFLDISSITTTPSRVQPGGFTDLRINVENLADSRLKDLKFKLNFNNLDIAPAGSSNEKTLIDLKARETATVTFRVVVDADAESQVYKIPLEIEYMDEIGTEYSRNHTIGLVVYGDTEYFLNIESSNVFTKNKKGDLVISISNIAPAEMRFVTIELKENDNYSVISTPKIYLGNIESDDEETAEFTIKTNKATGLVPLDVVLEYKDPYNKQFKAEEKVPLRVYTGRDAAVYGLVQRGSPVAALLTLSPVVLIGLFWFYNVRDCWKNKKKGFERTMWLIAIIGGSVLGAIVYYFVGRKKQV
ncbi:PLDc N-terminal domain-containing protein [Candidatus Woesearchaeota archaeon]|nr:PLDc N-terminal domain-containing protein [Candidatus Woesearchaeota archaeon]